MKPSDNKRQQRIDELDKLIEFVRVTAVKNKEEIQQFKDALILEQKTRTEQLKQESEAREKQLKQESEAREKQLKQESEAREKQLKQKEKERKKEIEDQKKRTQEHNDWIKQMREEFGGHQKTLSEIIEDAVYHKLSQMKSVGGIAFDSIAKNVRDFDQREYDIVLQNGKYTALIEVKQKARSKDIKKLLEEQVGALRDGFRLPKNQRIIAGIAGRVIPEAVRKEAEKKGVVIITQNGDDISFANSPGFKPKTY